MGVRTLPLWCGAAVVLFAAVVRAAFVGDDLESLLFASQGPSWSWLSDLGARDQARPLTWLSYWAEHRLFGATSTGYHAVGLVLHGLNAWLVGRVAKRLIGERHPRVPLLAGLAFLVSPAHIEPVAWIAARADLLMTGLSLCAVLAWLRWRDEGGPWAGAAVALGAVALAAKEPAVALVGVLAAFEVALPAPAGRRRQQRWAWLGGLGALAALHLLRLRSLAPDYAAAQASAYLADGPVVLLRRAGQIAIRTVVPGLEPVMWGVLAYLALATLGVGLAMRRRGWVVLRVDADDRRVLVAVTLAALVAIVPVARFGASLTSQAGERFAYLPSAFVLVGLALAFAGLLPDAPERLRLQQLVVPSLVAVGLLLLGASVHGRAASVSGQLLDEQAAWPTDVPTLALAAPDQIQGVFVNRFAHGPGLELLHGWTAPAAYSEVARYESGLEPPEVAVEAAGCDGCLRLELVGPDARWLPVSPGEVQGYLGPDVDLEVLDDRTAVITLGPDAPFQRFVVASEGRWVEVDMP
jgi:hypothetical protein